MRLPNGYGTVYKLSGSRRKPWIARRTKEILFDETTNKSKQIFETLGYYETRQAALKALADYNENPYDLSKSGTTFADVYKLWSDEHFNEIVPSAIRTWKSAYAYCNILYDIPMKDIKTKHLEDTIKNADVGDNTKLRMKSLFNLMYRYAMKHEIVDKDYAVLCNSVKKAKPSRDIVPFTDYEIQSLWDNINIPFVDMILIDIYSGWRPQELSLLKIRDIDLDTHIMFGGLKTDAGRNRCVPIHDRIYHLIKKHYDSGEDFLFLDENGSPMTYDKYRGRFTKVMKRLQMNHHPHEARHTFITMGKTAGMDEYIIKLIVGHAISDITEKTYTHRTLEQLKSEISKIK